MTLNHTHGSLLLSPQLYLGSPTPWDNLSIAQTPLLDLCDLKLDVRKDFLKTVTVGTIPTHFALQPKCSWGQAGIANVQAG